MYSDTTHLDVLQHPFLDLRPSVLTFLNNNSTNAINSSNHDCLTGPKTNVLKFGWSKALLPTLYMKKGFMEQSVKSSLLYSLLLQWI